MNLEPLNVIRDDRGAFVEAFHLPNDGQVSYLVANPNEMRGNHYHMRKTEHFLVVDGTATFHVKNRETGDVINIVTGGHKPMVVSVSPNHTHNLVASPTGCTCIIWCDERYDPDDADTFEEEI